MQVKKAYLKVNCTHGYRHSSGLNGRITGLVFVTPEGSTERLCYELMWDSGDLDYVPVSDVIEGLYQIVDTDK